MAARPCPCLLLRDRHSELDRLRIVRHDLASNTVLQRSDDLATRGVILGIGREAEQHVERQAHRITFDLDVAFLHDVEEADLNFPGEVGKLIQREDAAVRARKHSVVNRELVGEHVSTTCGSNGIDVADDVGDRYVGCRQLLDESAVAIDPGDRGRFAAFVENVSGVLRDWRERIVVHFAAGDDWNHVVEKRRKGAEDARLGLPAKTEKYEVMPREQGVDDLGHDRFLIPDYALKERTPAGEPRQEVFAKLVLY